MIGRFVSHYRVEEHLGGGAMGVVYRATDVHLDRPVALKFLPREIAIKDDAELRFANEAKAASALDHPHIVTVYDIDRTDEGQLFIAMAYYPGATLKSKIARGPLRRRDAVLYAVQIAEGLEEAHRHGIIHRDIKPSNVLVTEQDKAKIVDFGLARLVESSTVTDSGAVLGTALYMSPEQILGRTADCRTDLWSLGVLLFEMITGQLPFEGDNAAAVFQSVLNTTPKRVEDFDSDCPAAVQDVIDQALQKNREARFSDATEMLAPLRRIFSALSTERFPTEVLEPPRKRRRRRRLLGWVAVFFITAAGLIVASNWYTSEPSHPSIKTEPAARYFDQARDYEKRGDLRAHLQNAEQLYRQALEADPENPHIQAHLSALLARMDPQWPVPGRIEEARQLAQVALDRAPDLPCVWEARGRLYFLDGDFKNAEVAAREAIQHDVQYCPAHVLLGEALVARQRPEEGLEIIRESVALENGHVWAQPTLARLLMHLGRYDEAVVEYNKTLELLPDSPNALNNLGVINMREGDYPQAALRFQQVLDIQPSAMEAMNLGTAYFYMDQMQRAAEAYLQAHEWSPNDPLIQANLGECYEKLGVSEMSQLWYQRAIDTYDAEFQIHPPSAEKLADRAFYAAKAGRFDEAIRGVVEAITVGESDQIQPDSLVLFQAAKIYALAGERSETLVYTEQALAAGHSVTQFEAESSFAGFRNDPEFRALLEQGSDS